MGYMCHHAIIVTSWDKGSIVAAHKKEGEIMEIKSIQERVT